MSQAILSVLQAAVKVISSTSDTAQLDAEILLTSVLNVSRSFLHAWPEKIISEEEIIRFDQYVKRRVQGEPIPYITGHQEFWSLDFIVTPDTLIPRPDTELIIELVLKIFKHNSSTDSTEEPITIADLGTGGGAIALSIAHERPAWRVHATDQSASALSIARLNAEKLHIKNVIFHQGNWCNALPPAQFDMIVSNPPYIAEGDIHLNQGGLRFEPKTALTSGIDGLDAIREIIDEARHFLKPGAYLILEHGYQQAEAVRGLFKATGYEEVSSERDLSGWERVTLGKII